MKRTMLRHAFVAIVLLVCLPLTFAGEGQQVGDAVAFFISKEDHTTKTVKTTVRNGVEVSCSFQFATSATKKIVHEAPVVSTEGKKTDKKKTTKDVLEKLHGQCGGSNKGFWRYEVCIGKSVKQSHKGDVFFLGKAPEKLATDTARSQKYVGGDVCAAVTGRPQRQATVSYSCAEKLDIISVSETSTCVYSLVLGHPEFCGAQGYAKVAPHVNQMASHTNLGSRDNNHENWFMEINSFDGGDNVVCAVRCADESRESGGSTLNFNEFVVTMQSTTGHTVQYKQHRARASGRKDLGKKELVSSASHEKAIVTQSGEFTGAVQYFQLKGTVE